MGLKRTIKSSDIEVPRLLRGGWPLLWIALAAFLLFGRTISYDYTYLDDHNLVMSQMKDLQSFSTLSAAFSEDVFHFTELRGNYYRPMLTLSFMADAMIGKGSLEMFHFTNILFHVLAAILFFLLLVGAGIRREFAMTGSLLFTVHPMVTQAVAWVPGRNDTLLAIFILASFLAFLRYIRNNRPADLTVHLFLFLLALLTKENAVVLPFLLILFARTVTSGPWKKLILPGTGWGILLLFWFILRRHALAPGPGESLSGQEFSLIANLPALLPYLGKLIFPVHLSVLPVIADMKLAIMAGIPAFAMLVFLVVFSGQKRWALCVSGGAWFLAFLVPTLISFAGHTMNFSEHRSYLPLMGLIMGVLACLPDFREDRRTRLVLFAGAGLVILSALLTWKHSSNFRDRFAFWKNAVQTSPSYAFTHNNLGGMYFMEGDLVNAEKCFRQAIRINPREPMANSNMGLVCAYTKRLADAEKYYLEEIRVNPGYDHVHYNLGLVYINQTRTAEAIEEWEQTLQMNPGHRDAFRTLLYTYRQLGRQSDYDRILRAGQQHGLSAEAD